MSKNNIVTEKLIVPIECTIQYNAGNKKITSEELAERLKLRSTDNTVRLLSWGKPNYDQA